MSLPPPHRRSPSLTPTRSVDVVDFFPIVTVPCAAENYLLRLLLCNTGDPYVRSVCAPAFDFGRSAHTVEIEWSGSMALSALFTPADPLLEPMRLFSTVPLELGPNGSVTSEFIVHHDTPVFFAFGAASLSRLVLRRDAVALMKETQLYWRAFVASSKHHNFVRKRRDIVSRQLLVLELMRFYPTGAFVAAPTTSLPEVRTLPCPDYTRVALTPFPLSLLFFLTSRFLPYHLPSPSRAPRAQQVVGGDLNWDYRFSWPRDSSFYVYTYFKVGLYSQAKQAMDFFERALLKQNGGHIDGTESIRCPSILTIDGELLGEEEILSHLSGYKNSAPVRTGNQAAAQAQLDCYGALVDAWYMLDRFSPAGVPLQTWHVMVALALAVLERWRMPCHSLWEERHVSNQRYTYTAMMCWVALDRIVRIVKKARTPHTRSATALRLAARCENECKEIRYFIDGMCFSTELGSYTMYPRSTVLDSSVLIAPLVKFSSLESPMFQNTLTNLVCTPSYPG